MILVNFTSKGLPGTTRHILTQTGRVQHSLTHFETVQGLLDYMDCRLQQGFCILENIRDFNKWY